MGGDHGYEEESREESGEIESGVAQGRGEEGGCAKTGREEGRCEAACEEIRAHQSDRDAARCGRAAPVPHQHRSRQPDEAARFYGELLGLDGRRQAGSRVYFDAGGVTLQVVDVSAMGMGVPHPAAKALYFLVDDLDAVFARAKTLGCLSQEIVHGARGGEITVRPWGERSFYAEDKWLNPLCFVEAGTVYPG
jgi:hypothetical protein